MESQSHTLITDNHLVQNTPRQSTTIWYYLFVCSFSSGMPLAGAITDRRTDYSLDHLEWMHTGPQGPHL